MLNEIFNVVAPIAKTLIEGCVYSAITEDHSPKKTENIYTGGDIVKSVIRNYNAMSQLDPNKKENESDSKPISIQYKETISAPTVQQQEEETFYTLAKKKKYKYNF